MESSDFNPAIPTPESITGHALAEKAVRHRALERYLLALSEASENWLVFGLKEKLPVMFWGSNGFMSKYPVATPVRLADKNELRLSGLLWPEAKERI